MAVSVSFQTQLINFGSELQFVLRDFIDIIFPQVSFFLNLFHHNAVHLFIVLLLVCVHNFGIAC